MIAPLWVKSFDEGNVPHTADKLRLLYPQDYVLKNSPEHLEQFNRFLADLSQATGSEVSCISISEMWEKYPPPNVKDQNIHEYLKDVIVNTYYWSFYDSQAWLRETYLKEHGKSPFVNAFVKWRWGLGQSVTDAQHEEGMRRLPVYRSWLLDQVLLQHGNNAVLILPISESAPNYRDKPPSEPSIQSGFDPLYLSPILGSPDLVLPIGQIPYDSKVTGCAEILPVCVTLVGKPGGDADLIKLARSVFQSSGRPSIIRTGSSMFG